MLMPSARQTKRILELSLRSVKIWICLLGLRHPGNIGGIAGAVNTSNARLIEENRWILCWIEFA